MDPEGRKTYGSGTLPKSTVCCEKGPGQILEQRDTKWTADGHDQKE
jgi:hypothetical protein